MSLDSAGLQGDADSSFATVSADGRYVVFVSAATNLVPDDTNGVADVFVHDRDTGATTRVSVASDGTQGNDRSGAIGAGSPAISADGRYVAFDSDASNLVGGDSNGSPDVFVHDRQTGETTRVSVSTGGTEGNSGSYSPSISADGRYVAFDSDASNLLAGDGNGSADVFVRDRVTSETSRVSVSSAGAEGDGDSYWAAISADGRYVAFESIATDLVLGDTNGVRDIFRHDLQSPEATIRVSVADDGSQANDASFSASISADGRYVAFDSDASNLVSGDSNFIADVFVRDCDGSTTERASVSTGGGQGDDGSAYAALSSDARYVAFESYASTLVADDTNEVRDVFVRDRQAGETKRVSTASDGTQANDGSLEASISADGSYIAFHSGASNLVAGDTNAALDVFLSSVLEVTLTLSGSNGQVEVDGTSHALPWSGTFAYGVSVALEAFPDECWLFDGWDGDLTGDENPTTVVMNGDREIDVLFSSLAIFSDVACDFWAASHIAACYHADLVAGYPDGTYQPSFPVSRDQMAVYVGRALAGGEEGVPEGPPEPTFPDVPNTGYGPDETDPYWAYDHIEYCVSEAVVKGFEDGLYWPALEVTRDQMAVYIARSIVTPTGEEGLVDYVPPAEPTFPDVPNTGYGPDETDPYWAYKHIEYCAENGVVQGYEDGYYHPEVVVTRDQMAVYIARAFELPL